MRNVYCIDLYCVFLRLVVFLAVFITLSQRLSVSSAPPLYLRPRGSKKGGAGNRISKGQQSFGLHAAQAYSDRLLPRMTLVPDLTRCASTREGWQVGGGLLLAPSLMRLPQLCRPPVG
jgi:hypothetical protein